MSQGLGMLQRKALLVLWRADGHRVPLGDLKRELAADRANARRAIRGLLDRGMVEETGPERDLALTSGAVMALFLAEYAKGAGLVEARLPSRPLDLDDILSGADEDESSWLPHGSRVTPWKTGLIRGAPLNDNSEDPHGSWEPPWIRELSSDPPVRDNVASSAAQRIADALDNGKELER